MNLNTVLTCAKVTADLQLAAVGCVSAEVLELIAELTAAPAEAAPAEAAPVVEETVDGTEDAV